MPGVPPSVLASYTLRGVTWKTAEQAGFPSGLLPADNNNFAPFVGFAWSLHGDGMMGKLFGKNRTVIRAGYGISYQRDSLYVVHMTSAFEPNGRFSARRSSASC